MSIRRRCGCCCLPGEPRSSRRKVALVQLRSVIVTAPDGLRERAASAAARRAAQPLQPLPSLQLTHALTSSQRSSCCARSPAASRPPPPKPKRSRGRSSTTSGRSPPSSSTSPVSARSSPRQLIVTWSHHDRIDSEAVLRPPRRRRTATRLQRPHHPPPAQPRRRPPTQPRAPHDRPPPPPTRPGDPRLHRPPHQRRQDKPRRHTAAQALPRPTPLPRHAELDPTDHLTVIGASFRNTGAGELRATQIRRTRRLLRFRLRLTGSRRPSRCSFPASPDRAQRDSRGYLGRR